MMSKLRSRVEKSGLKRSINEDHDGLGDVRSAAAKKIKKFSGLGDVRSAAATGQTLLSNQERKKQIIKRVAEKVDKSHPDD